MPSSGTPPAASGAARLSGVWPPYATTAGRRSASSGDLGVDDAAHALRVERLEVEPGRGVEVGRDGLRVRVDHHRAPAGAAERVGGLDRAVVELDPLPDPDRPGADDEGGRTRDRRRLGRRAGGGVGRVEVRRLGRELRGAGVDHRVAGAQAEGQPGGPDLVGGRAGQPGQLAVAEAGALGRGEERRPRRRRSGRRCRAPVAAHLGLERDVAAHLGEEPRRDAGRLADDRLRHAPPEQPEQPPQPAVGRREEPAQDDRRGGPLGVAGRFARLAGLVDPADRLVRVGVAGVDARRGSRRSGARRRPRRAARRRPARARGAPC